MQYLFNRIVASTLVALSPAFAMAQTGIPTKAITFVVLVAPGSSNDLIARMLSKKLPAKLGQPVIVDNRPGTSDFDGAASVARSASNGHTIVIVPSDIDMAPILTPKAGGANFNTIKDFSPTLAAGSASMLIVPYRGVLPAVNAVLATSEFRDRLRGMGVQITGGTSGDAAKLARDTHARNQQVVKDLNITVEWATS